MQKRTFLAALAAAPLTSWLSGCGGGSDSEKAKVRFVNASIGYGSLDFYLGDDRKASAVAYGAASGYSKVDADDYSAIVRQADGSTALDSTDASFVKETRYSIVAYGERGSLDTKLITESEDEPDDGEVKLAVFNVTDSAVGLYIADAGDALEDAVAVVSSAAAGSTSDFVTESKGTYTLYVTTVADEVADREVLLKIDAVALNNRDVATLIVMPSSGAVLVNAMLLKQDDDATAYTNTESRVRLVAGVSGRKVVAQVGSTTLSASGGTTGPAVGSYVRITAGESTVNVTVDGESVSAAALTAAQGADYTLVVYGASDFQVKTLTDDNALPSDDAKTSFRFVHLAPAYADEALSLFLNTSKALGSDVAYGGASSYVDQTPVSSADGSNKLEAKIGQNGTTIWTVNDTAIDAQAVYTLFLFGQDSAYLATDRDASS